MAPGRRIWRPGHLRNMMACVEQPNMMAWHFAGPAWAREAWRALIAEMGRAGPARGCPRHTPRDPGRALRDGPVRRPSPGCRTCLCPSHRLRAGVVGALGAPLRMPLGVGHLRASVAESHGAWRAMARVACCLHPAVAAAPTQVGSGRGSQALDGASGRDGRPPAGTGLPQVSRVLQPVFRRELLRFPSVQGRLL